MVVIYGLWSGQLFGAKQLTKYPLII